MKAAFKRSFLKSVKKLKDQKLKDAIAESIEQIEASEKLSDINNLKSFKDFQISTASASEITELALRFRTMWFTWLPLLTEKIFMASFLDFIWMLK